MSERLKTGNCRRSSAPLLTTLLGLTVCLVACSERPSGVTEQGEQSSHAGTSQSADPSTAAVPDTVEKGVFFKPDLSEFALQNEYDDDGDGDGVNETHIRRYMSRNGDTAFSMQTGDSLWAWSLDTQAGDDSNIRQNYVIRDSNCDGVFDERYSLTAEFHVPSCLAKAGEAGS